MLVVVKGTGYNKYSFLVAISKRIPRYAHANKIIKQTFMLKKKTISNKLSFSERIMFLIPLTLLYSDKLVSEWLTITMYF